MRKTGLLAGFIALTLIVGCESDGCKFTYSKYYIENYVDGDLVLLPYYAVRSSASDLPAPVSEGFGVSIYEGVYYQSPELKGAQHPDEFLRIAERNGDTEFNDLKSPPEQGIIAFADNFTGIKVTSDKDWSAEYPAGTSLNDKMGVRYVSYAEYIESGYPPGFDLGKDILYDKPLSALQPDDLRVVEYTPSSLSIYTLFYVGSRQSGRGAHFYGGIHHFGRYGQDCLDNLHAGGRSCVAINSRQEQHNIRSNFNTG